jgi:hypothetical protein
MTQHNAWPRLTQGNSNMVGCLLGTYMYGPYLS